MQQSVDPAENRRRGISVRNIGEEKERNNRDEIHRLLDVAGTPRNIIFIYINFFFYKLWTLSASQDIESKFKLTKLPQDTVLPELTIGRPASLKPVYRINPVHFK